MPSFCMQSPIGPLTITSKDEAIVSVEFKASKQMDNTPVLIQAKEQLDAYFKGELKDFNLKLSPNGTPFQQKVWQALRQIPYGNCASYKNIAENIGNPKAMRAVGGANNKNPIPIIIPCHRVIGADGSLVGYASGVDKKTILLELEGAI